MILEMNTEEMMIFNSLSESGLSDFAILAQLFDNFGITTRKMKTSEIVDSIKGCVAS